MLPPTRLANKRAWIGELVLCVAIVPVDKVLTDTMYFDQGCSKFAIKFVKV